MLRSRSFVQTDIFWFSVFCHFSVLEEPPSKIHNLSRLAEKSGLDKDMSEGQTDFIDELEPLNIEARYPSYKERLTKSLTADRCKDLIEQTDKLRTWIKSKL